MLSQSDEVLAISLTAEEKEPLRATPMLSPPTSDQPTDGGMDDVLSSSIATTIKSELNSSLEETKESDRLIRAPSRPKNNSNQTSNVVASSFSSYLTNAVPIPSSSSSTSSLTSSSAQQLSAAEDIQLHLLRQQSHHHHHHHKNNAAHRPHHSHSTIPLVANEQVQANTLSVTATPAIASTSTSSLSHHHHHHSRSPLSLDPHQSLLAQSSNSDLVFLNSSLLQELQYYDILTRELSIELESTLEHLTNLQAETQQLHATSEQSEIQLEVLRASRLKEELKLKEERKKGFQELFRYKKQLSKLKAVLRSLGKEPNEFLGGLGGDSKMNGDDFRIDVDDDSENELSSTTRSASTSTTPRASSRLPKSHRSKTPKTSKSKPRLLRARTEPGIGVNGIADVIEEEEDDEEESSSESATSSSSSDEDEERKESHVGPKDDTLQLAESVNGLDLSPPAPTAATTTTLHPTTHLPATSAASSTLTSSHQLGAHSSFSSTSSTNSAHPYLHLGLLDSTAPVSASDYLALHESHTIALERIKQLEDKLLDQQQNWMVYLDLVTTKFETALHARQETKEAQTTMILNTPATGVLAEFADEKLVYVTPNIWRAVGKAMIQRDRKAKAAAASAASTAATKSATNGEAKTHLIVDAAISSTTAPISPVDRFITPFSSRPTPPSIAAATTIAPISVPPPIPVYSPTPLSSPPISSLPTSVPQSALRQTLPPAPVLATMTPMSSIASPSNASYLNGFNLSSAGTSSPRLASAASTIGTATPSNATPSSTVPLFTRTVSSSSSTTPSIPPSSSSSASRIAPTLPVTGWTYQRPPNGLNGTSRNSSSYDAADTPKSINPIPTATGSPNSIIPLSSLRSPSTTTVPTPLSPSSMNKYIDMAALSSRSEARRLKLQQATGVITPTITSTTPNQTVPINSIAPPSTNSSL